MEQKSDAYKKNFYAYRKKSDKHRNFFYHYKMENGAALRNAPSRWAVLTKSTFNRY
ncbi:hypothetical protein [Riemerella columbina]|uniref:hypothetical protein n=1 Tax=Riemerella columbina TaxID=103810 RepID=UPI00267096F7|nr:hypothetical protein [Riemerella columbina]WKS94670.1 hypothetical protein NYR17_06975 [Riemerella columbina]